MAGEGGFLATGRVLYHRRTLDPALKPTKRLLQPIRSLTASRICEVVQKLAFLGSVHNAALP